jgi:hypothetical protein
MQPRIVTRDNGQPAADPADPARGDKGCYYALHRIDAAAVTQCYLALWSRGALEVFVNGALIAMLDPALGDGRTNHVVPVGLAQGHNHVLIKTCSRDMIHVTAASHQVAQFVYQAAGTQGLRAGTVQRLFRDMHAGTQHVIASPPVYQAVGRELAGLAEGQQWQFLNLVDAKAS